MPTTISNYTGTGQMTHEVVTVYDKLFEFALRSRPTFRDWVDKRPADVTSSGESVVFNLYQDLAVATTALSEAVVPDSVAISDTTQVTVTLAEYGNWVNESRRLSIDALSDVDAGIANILAYNCINSLDAKLQSVLAANGTQIARRAAGALGIARADGVGTAPAANTTVATDLFQSGDVRKIVAALRTQNVIPRVEELFIAAIHPMVSADLRSETGDVGWRQPHEYNDGGVSNVWNGVVGTYEGCMFQENSRLTSAQTGAGAGATQTRVFDTYFLGQQAIAEAVNVEPEIRPGPITDPMYRFRPLTWYAFLGWNVYRQAALLRYNSSSSGWSAL